MEFKEIKGDLLKLSTQGFFDVIAHGCNCQKIMSGGIALAFKNTYPLCYETDKKSTSILGTLSICDDYDNLDITNCYTQFNLGHYNTTNEPIENRYNTIKNCMRNINLKYRNKHIGLPLIGCGISGLNWDKVKDILKTELNDLEKVTIVHYG